MADNFAGQRSPGDGNATGVPESFFPILWEEFSTLNTKPLRPAIGKDQCYWMDGFMPLGPSNARILPGTGPVRWSASGSVTVVWFEFFNIYDTQYVVVLTSDGALTQVNASTGVSTTIGGAGTISSPSTIMGMSQWGSQYLILSKDQVNGYWLWDANNLFSSGTLSPVVNVDNSGQGYSFAPTITLQTTGSGTGVRFQALIENGNVTQVNVTDPGSGFAVTDFVVATVSGGGSDSQAVLVPQLAVSSGGISEVLVTDGGQGYTGRAFGSIDGGGGTGAQVSLSILNGTITAVAILYPGSGYTSQPSITIVDPGIPGSPSIPGGSGFAGEVNIAFGQIIGVAIPDGGSGYTALPTITFIGDGTGAKGIPIIQGGQLIQVIMSAYGSGYTTCLAVAQNGNNAANVTPVLMPFGVSGTTVETYQGRVWVSNGSASATFPPKNRTIYSSPQSPVDFGDGGGAFQSYDSFLKVGYHSLKQANGFLYLIGDSSVNYISNVQTSSSGSANTVAVATTTFSNQNVDPQLGTPWPSSVQVFSRNIVFANSIGIFGSTGGALDKISTPMDGFYATVPAISGTGTNFSSAVATIFGTSVYMLLLPVVDQFTGNVVNKLLMWDGRRLWTSQQDRTLTYVATQELNSVLVAWGTDGTNIFPLFQNPTTGFQKVIQSKLYADPSYFQTKTSRSLSGIAYSYILDQPLTVTIDNDSMLGTGNASVSVLPSPNAAAWININDISVTWTNSLSETVIWGSPGLDVFGPIPVGQSGRLTGFTVSTTASNLALLSLMLSEQAFATNL